MPARKLKKFLDEREIPYVTITHSPAYTAQTIAHSAHISGRAIAKTVILNVDGKLVMAVVPGNEQVDLRSFRDAIGAKAVTLAEERDFLHTFPGCELGAMPPFGNLWDVPVYVAEGLREDEEIAFNAGSHTELFQMSFADFERLVQPTIVRMTHAHV